MTTSAPTAPIDICNLALDIIAEAVGSTIDIPDTQTEELMSRWYDAVRRSLLREIPWNFAQKYVELPRAGDGVGGYNDAYDLPIDFIRLNVVGQDIQHPIERYELSDGQILASNGDTLPLRYNRSVTEISKMDPLFVELLTLRLAEKWAYAITKKKTVVEYVAALVQRAEPRALSVDGQERPPRRVQNSVYLAARRRGGSIGRDNRYYHFS